jgi:hypothetical protein
MCPEHDSEDHGQEGEFREAQEIANETERKREAEIEQAVVERVDARQDQREDEAGLVGAGAVHEPDAGRQDHDADADLRDDGDERAHIEAVDHLWVLLEEPRARQEPVHQQAAEETAVEFELGMPKLRSGISVVLATVLLAASGAATPSSDPCRTSPGSSTSAGPRCTT